MSVEFINTELLDALSTAARNHVRKRVHHNFHPEDDSPSHRLLIAIEPGSYVVPHRHLDPNKDETFFVVRGRLALITFDDQGGVTGRTLLEAQGRCSGANIPSGIYHTLVSLESGTVMFESKSGPYVPIADNERAPWAPKEGDADVVLFMKEIERSMFG